MKLTKLLFFVFVFTLNNMLFSQIPKNTDSLINVLKCIKNDTIKVNSLLTISDIYSNTIPVKSLEYAQKALILSVNIRWIKGQGYAYHRIGFAYYSLGNYTAVLDNWSKELEKMEECNNKEAICSALGNIGVVYFQLGNKVKALEKYLKALKIAEEIGDKNKIIANLGNVGMIYKGQGNYSKAIAYHLKALKLSVDCGDKKFISSNLGSIAGIYWKQNNFQKALDYYYRALAIEKVGSNKRNIAAWLANIGGVYADLAKSTMQSKQKGSNFNNALENNFEASKLAIEIGDEGLLADIYGNIGSIYTEIAHFGESEIYLVKSLNLATKIKSIDCIKEVQFYLSKLYEQSKKPEKALIHFKLYTEAKDSILNEVNRKTLSELQIQYETEKKETDNKMLVSQNQVQKLTINNIRYIIIGVGCLFILAILIGMLLFRQNTLKSQHRAVQLEQKLLRMQMNPHFIFNSLASIESFIYEHQPKEAGMYLSKFSRLIRLILENSTSEYITLDKEIETLNFYLLLEKLRLNDNLEYIISVENSIIPEQIYLPPMLMQPFIENAIEHGFRGIKQRGLIQVEFKLAANNLLVQITDNGIGLVQAEQQKELLKEHKSMAINITKERLLFLNKAQKQKLHFYLIDLSDEHLANSGTRVVFSIPVVQ